MGKFAIMLLLAAAAGAVTAVFRRSPQDVVDETEPEEERPVLMEDDQAAAAVPEDEEDPVEAADAQEESRTCRAEVVMACQDLDPVTLQAWSRATFRCEDGEARRFTFAGGNGVYLADGEQGMLEYRGAAFVGFEKDSGEYITPLFVQLMPETEE